jgi:phospholipid-binding lipoprotein MlaA
MLRKTLAVCILVSTNLVGGCATQKSAERHPGDPFERMNRRIYAFNSAFDRALAEPVSRKYKSVTPRFVKTGISNFIDNLGYPAVIVNDALQGKGMPALRDTGRFVMNTTVGVVGFFDPATRVGLEQNDEDFGQTLGRWGVGSGPYVILPFGNPTTLRDGLARVADPFTSPITLSGSGASQYGMSAMRIANTGSKSSGAEPSLRETYDPYVVMRSVYFQKRAFRVYDGIVPEDPIEIEMQRQAALDLDDELMIDAQSLRQASIELSGAPPVELSPLNEYPLFDTLESGTDLLF